METTKYNTRFVSRITLEAETPFAVGSGKKDFLTDALVAKDINGLPYIPGTSLAGVIRNACGRDTKDCNDIFGYQNKSKNDGQGSRIIFSDAVMIGEDGKPVDGLTDIDWDSPFYKHFKVLPIRQHVRIGDKGVTEVAGKFDEQVTYKGTRFCFEMELLSTGSEQDRTTYDSVLNALCQDTFRIGGGTRNGLGKMKVVSLLRRDYNLNNSDDLEDYASHSACLYRTLKGAREVAIPTITNQGWLHYQLKLKPDDFFLFGSGMGDDEADMTPVREGFVEWKSDGHPDFIENGILIPATSIKGAIAHRTAFHWNKLKGRFVDADINTPSNNNETDDNKPKVGGDNPAVRAIFGRIGEGNEKAERGNIVLSDVIIPTKKTDANKSNDTKIINHVAIDRFTGGSLDGALFTEKVVNGRGRGFELNIYVQKSSLHTDDPAIRKAFEQALQDIANGLLPLGGGVNRGNGMFTGTLIKPNDNE